MTPPDMSWHVPVRLESVPESGLHLEIIADAGVRSRLAALAGLRKLSRLEAAIDITREGSGLRAKGRVSACVGQTCVITLEPLETSVEETFDVIFGPPDSAAGLSDAVEDTEPLVNGTADVGAVAAEFLLLGIDRYPKAPGAVFVPPADAGTDDGPFAGLARLKRGVIDDS
jgi:hypothetical protein